MHGTETPAQPNDAIKIDIPQPDLNSFGDIDQNSLDFDAPQSSGQWRNMQQVSERNSSFLHINKLGHFISEKCLQKVEVCMQACWSFNSIRRRRIVLMTFIIQLSLFFFPHQIYQIFLGWRGTC